MRLHQWLLLGAVAFAPLVPIQNAYAVTVEGTASFSDTGPSGNGLAFTGVFANAGAFSFDLTNGPKTLTDFLTITAIDTNYYLLRTAADTITTTFNITQPGNGNGSVDGTGFDTSLFFVLDHGNIHWNAPATIDLGNGTDLTIALSDASFLGSILTGGYPMVGINATFSLTGTSASVSQAPLPAALPLFATGLGAMSLLGWWRRRRQRAVVGAIA